MNIAYTQNGDYLISNIVIRKTKLLGHYGRLRKAYLKMHRPILFNELALSMPYNDFINPARIFMPLIP